MVKKVNHEELASLVKHYYEHKLPLFVWGTFGIGKSQVINEVARVKAVEQKREFVEWNKMTEEEKDNVSKEPEKYFVLIDIRLSEYDSSDIKGLPNFKDGEKSIEFRVPYWALLLENPKSDGILFFDEINLATPLVISSCYKIIYDRVVNNSKINENWLIMGCGNKSEDRAYTHDMAPPLRDRGGEVELMTPGIDGWTNWATQNAIDSRIIGFVNFKSSALFNVNFTDEQKFTTTRGWERVSKLIQGVSKYPQLDLVSGSAIGEGIAKEFVAFCKIKESIDLEQVIAKPEKLKGIKEIGIKYFVVTAVAEKYKDKKIKFDKVMGVSKVLDKIDNAEFVALLWKLCSGYNKKFKADFVANVGDKFAEKYSKYII